MSPKIDESLVNELLRSQFPQWIELPLRRIEKGGWCNVAFRLGNDKLVRLPRHEDYAPQAEKECTWLPRLVPYLSLEIPAPLVLGKPSDSFPWPWAVYQWIDGDVAHPERIMDMPLFACDLAQFLNALHPINTADAPLSGAHSFYRGGSLGVYSDQVTEAINLLRNRIDAPTVTNIWQRALRAHWAQPPVWIHGDMSVGNLLVREGKLVAVIDFGNMAVGDPACDLVMAWTIFDEASRHEFRNVLAVDDETRYRGRAWALWKALIIAAEISESNAYEARDPWKIIDTVLRDYTSEH